MFKTINIPSLRALGFLGGLFDVVSMITEIVSREPVFSEPEKNNATVADHGDSCKCLHFLKGAKEILKSYVEK